MLKNVIFFGLTLLSVQGTIYFLQILAAAQMSTEDYSQVRVVESLVAVIALLSTIGIPSIALVKIANSKSIYSSKLLIRNCILLVGFFVIVVSLVFVYVLHLGLFQKRIDIPLLIILTLSTLLSFRLLLVNTTQAFQKFGQLATVSLISCFISIIFFEITKYLNWSPVDSWIWARIILEAFICVGLLTIRIGFKKFSINSTIKTCSISGVQETPKILFFAALPIGMSLILRSIVEHGPILWLASIGAPVNVIAEVGFILTLATIVLMPSGVIQGVILPRLSIALSAKEYDRKDLKQLLFLFTVLSASTAMVFALTAYMTLSFLPFGKFMTSLIIFGGSVIVASKLIASSIGGYLLAANRKTHILTINSITFLLSVMAALVYQFEFVDSLKTLHILWGIAFLEACAAICYLSTIFLNNNFRNISK